MKLQKYYCKVFTCTDLEKRVKSEKGLGQQNVNFDRRVILPFVLAEYRDSDVRFKLEFKNILVLLKTLCQYEEIISKIAASFNKINLSQKTLLQRFHNLERF